MNFWLSFWMGWQMAYLSPGWEMQGLFNKGYCTVNCGLQAFIGVGNLLGSKDAEGFLFELWVMVELICWNGDRDVSVNQNK